MVEMVCEKVNTIKTTCENMYIVVELLSMLMPSRIAYNFALENIEQPSNFAAMFVLDGPLYIPELAILLCPS